MRNAGIIHYALFWNGNNGLQWAYFVNQGYVETREPQTRGLSVNSTANSLSPNFLVCFANIWTYFSMKTKKEKIGNALSAWANFCVDLTWWMGNVNQIWEIEHETKKEFWVKNLKQKALHGFSLQN